MNTSSAFTSSLLLALVASGCGDGVGEPITKDSSSIDGGSGGKLCSDVASWDADAARDEAGIVPILNGLRTARFVCGATADGASLEPLTVAAELRCSARRHARDMAQRGYFSETNPERETVEVRVSRAGYRSAAVGEIILSESGGFEAVAQLAQGGADCAELTDPRFVAVGVGKFAGLWAIDFAGPRLP